MRTQSPEMAMNHQATSLADIEKGLKVLQANKNKWVATSIDERINFLDKIGGDLKPLSDRWVALSMEAKGIPQHTFGEEEEKIFLGSIFGLIGALRQSLADIKKYGRPQIAGPISVGSGSRQSSRESIPANGS